MEDNMTKLLVTSVATLAMMSGVAFAQAVPGTMTQSTEIIRSSRPVEPDVKTTTQERMIDDQGNTTVKKQTVTKQGGATASTSTAKTITPDGAVTSQSTEERTTTPFGETHSTTRTVTTDR
jgi:hypothetical protein